MWGLHYKLQAEALKLEACRLRSSTASWHLKNFQRDTGMLALISYEVGGRRVRPSGLFLRLSKIFRPKLLGIQARKKERDNIEG
jgi:hypothetical protein